MIFVRKKVFLETISELETEIAGLRYTIRNLERDNSDLRGKIEGFSHLESCYTEQLVELGDLHRKEVEAERERYALLLERHIAMMDGRLDNERREAD